MKITDTARGTVQTVTKNTAGVYPIPGLTTSTYSMKVSVKGYRAIARNGLIFDMAQTLSISFWIRAGRIHANGNHLTTDGLANGG